MPLFVSSLVQPSEVDHYLPGGIKLWVPQTVRKHHPELPFREAGIGDAGFHVSAGEEPIVEFHP